MTEQELTATLMKIAEEEVTRIVAWDKEKQTMNLTELEDKMLASRQAVYAKMTEVLIEQQEAKRNAALPVNGQTHKRLQSGDV